MPRASDDMAADHPLSQRAAGVRADAVDRVDAVLGPEQRHDSSANDELSTFADGKFVQAADAFGRRHG